MVFSYRDLYIAWKKESRGKHGLENQQRYRYNLEERLYLLCEKLNNGKYVPSPLRIKAIYYPKRREAQVPSQEDKIVQHAISDEHAYHRLVAPLIDGASANTRGRGTDYGVERLKKDLRRFWAAHKQPPFILKADVSSFFGSIPHKRVNEIIDRQIEDREINDILKRFVNLTERGLPLGLQQSQLLANIYLSEYDHSIKEKFRMKFYGRHMDDLYILSDSRETLAEILLWTTNYFDRIGLKLNPKTAITFRSFEYLGFGFTVGDTGKIIVRVAKSKLKSKRRHIKKMAEQLGAGRIAPERFETMYFGWRAHASKAKNARTQIMNMDRYANNVLNQAGYRLEIVKHKKGRVKWRVKITKKE